MLFFLNMNIFLKQRDEKKKCIKVGPMITCAKFGVKMFLQARDAAVNLVYNVVRISGSFLHREWQSALALPLIHSCSTPPDSLFL